MPSTALQRLYARTVFYPTLAWNVALGRWLKFRRWWDRIEPQVIVGARPFRVDVPLLHAEGVTGVVNTCEEYLGPVAQYEQLGIEQLHIPTTDFAHPMLADVEIAVDFVQRHVDSGGTVYVHCKAGRARSATVVLCWLIKYRGLTAEDGQRLLLEKRPHTNPRLSKRPIVLEFQRKFSASGTPASDTTTDGAADRAVD